MTHHIFEIDYEPEVVDQIRALPRELQLPLIRRVAELAEDPRPAGFEKLDAGCRLVWRSVRITYWIDDANGWVHIARVAPEPPSIVD